MTSRKSGLSCKEQRRYLDLFHKYLVLYRPQQPNPTEIKELVEFEALQVRVSSEQSEFQSYVQQVSKCRHFDYNHLVPAASKYIDEKLNYEWRRVDQYPRYYTADKTVPLSIPTGADYAPSLTHQKLLLELGSFPKVFLPDMSRGPTVVPTAYIQVNRRFPSSGRNTTSTTAWNHQACSKDQNAETLAERYECQLVLSTSVLKCLVDNHGPKYDTEWELPVTVKLYEHDYGEISSKQKIVYMDKPFAPKTLTNRDKNSLYHKYALKSFISQAAIHKGHGRGPATTQKGFKQAEGGNPPTKGNNPKRPTSTNPFDDDVNMDAIETFGSFDFGAQAKSSVTRQSRLKVSDEGKVERRTEVSDKDLMERLKANVKNEKTTVGKAGVSGSIPEDTTSSTVEESSVATSGHKAGGVERSSLSQQRQTSKGETLKGEASKGRTSKGETLKGETSKVETSKGETSKVETSKGETSKGETSKVETSKGETSKVETSKGENSKGENSKGNTTKGVDKSAITQECTNMFSSGGDTSQDEGLVIDIPECPTPPPRTTRSQSRLNLNSSVVSDTVSQTKAQKEKETKNRDTTTTALMSCSDDEKELVIDLDDADIPKKSQSCDQSEFSVPKRTLRKRKTNEMKTPQEYDSDPSPERRSLRLQSNSTTKSRSRSRSNSCSRKSVEDDSCDNVKKSSVESKKVIEGTKTGDADASVPSRDVLISPSKVDNIMIKTASEDLASLPATSEAPAVSTQKRPGRAKKVGVSPLDSILQMQEKMLPTGRGLTGTAGHGTENPSEFWQPEEHNVAYNLWSFSGLTLLIRSSCHGVLKDLARNTVQPVCIVPKLEYQLRYGVEQATMSEVSRDWISCYVKPNTKLVRGRINGLTSELVKIDEVDPHSIVNTALSFVPQNALGSLHNLFLRLTELPSGQYLLRHSKGDNFCQLLRNTNTKRGAYDLKFSYMGFGASVPTKAESGVPWVPIDPTVVLPTHKKNGRIPCTFDPPDYSQPNQRKFSHKKKKKKNKGQKRKQYQGNGNSK